METATCEPGAGPMTAFGDVDPDEGAAQGCREVVALVTLIETCRQQTALTSPATAAAVTAHTGAMSTAELRMALIAAGAVIRSLVEDLMVEHDGTVLDWLQRWSQAIENGEWV